jgi:CheY-like chemotaxis protein
VLVAEDNKVNQQLARTILAKAGHRVEVAADGKATVDAVRARDFDVVLMDIQMPVMDGKQATAEIRALAAPKSRLPIIAVTAHAMVGAKQEYLDAGMNDYLSKPLNAALLLAKLDEIAISVPPAATRAGAETENSGAIDAGALDLLCRTVGDTEFDKLLPVLLSAVADSIDAIESLMHRGDFAAAQREAHNLVSTAGSLGAVRVSDRARALQTLCERGEAERCFEGIAALRQAFAELRRPLRDFLENRSPPGTGRASAA